MRGIRGAIVMIAAMGCGGDGADDTGSPDPVANCNYATKPLAEVESTQWPTGLAESLSAYQQLNGVWTAADCVDPLIRHEIKITTRPQEELQVVDGGVSQDACGCTQDPLYDHDNTMSPVALVPRFEVFVPAGIDPGVDARTYEFSGALFGPGEPLAFRGCAHRQIDPADASEFDDAWLTIRALSADDTVSMSIKLASLGAGDQAVICELTDWVKAI